jgi:amino acid permease
MAGGVQYACLLYLEAKNNVPVHIGSIYELSYVCTGRKGIFLVAMIQFINSSGLNIIYFIVFGDITASLIKALFYPDSANFLTTRACYVFILGLCLVIPLLKKQLLQIKFVSVILFIAIGCFVGLMMVQFIT